MLAEAVPVAGVSVDFVLSDGKATQWAESRHDSSVGQVMTNIAAAVLLCCCRYCYSCLGLLFLTDLTPLGRWQAAVAEVYCEHS